MLGLLGDPRHALHAHTCRVGTRTRHSRGTSKAARHALQGCVHGRESMGRLLRPGMCAKLTHIELRLEHRAPRLLPARCELGARQCQEFQALGRRRGEDDRRVGGAKRKTFEHRRRPHRSAGAAPSHCGLALRTASTAVRGRTAVFFVAVRHRSAVGTADHSTAVRRKTPHCETAVRRKT